MHVPVLAKHSFAVAVLVTVGAAYSAYIDTLHTQGLEQQLPMPAVGLRVRLW